MDVARLEFKLRIPEELQVIGFDDIPHTEWLNYQLTSFQQDFSRLSGESVKIIVEHFVEHIAEQSASLVKLMIPIKFIERNTTKKKNHNIIWGLASLHYKVTYDYPSNLLKLYLNSESNYWRWDPQFRKGSAQINLSVDNDSVINWFHYPSSINPNLLPNAA